MRLSALDENFLGHMFLGHMASTTHPFSFKNNFGKVHDVRWALVLIKLSTALHNVDQN